VTRALGQLYPTGLIRRKGRNLYLMDRSGLERIVHALEEHGGRGSRMRPQPTVGRLAAPTA
jgi:hypothetical protein